MSTDGRKPVQTFLRSESSEADAQWLQYTSPIKLEIDVPDNFNGKELWKDLLSPVIDQGKCGSCWAFSSASCLADRFNIHSEGKIHVQLSAARMVICNWQNDKFANALQFNITEDIKNAAENRKVGCYGNSLSNAWSYLYTVGTTTEACVPYRLRDENKPISEFESADDIPLCIEMTGIFSDMCSDFQLIQNAGKELGTPARFYRCYQYYSIPGTPKDGGNERNIRMHIYKYGPVTTGILTNADFYTFDAKNTIYDWDGISPFTGGHAVVIVGWGTENGVDFWWIKNSWGTDWGIDGYFKMVRGKNLCEVEANVMTGMPDFWFPFDLRHIDPKLYDFYWKDWLVAEDIQMKRLQSDIGINAVTGGLDPRTGFTTRIQVVMPNVNFIPPLDWRTDLPDYKNWMAATCDYIKRKQYELLTRSRKLARVRMLMWCLVIACIVLGLLIYAITKKTQ